MVAFWGYGFFVRILVEHGHWFYYPALARPVLDEIFEKIARISVKIFLSQPFFLPHPPAKEFKAYEA